MEMETLKGMERTHHCGQLRKSEVDQEVVLCGWVSRRRDHGGLIFVDMRDRSGFVQVDEVNSIEWTPWIFDNLIVASGTGCIIRENPRMGLYFIEDPDGSWIEILPVKNATGN